VYIVISTGSIQLLAALLLYAPDPSGRRDFLFSPLYREMMRCSVLCHYVKMLKQFLLSFTHNYTQKFDVTTTRESEREIVERTQQTNRRKCFHVVLSMMESQGRLKTGGGKTYANSEKLFSAFFFFLPFSICLLSLGTVRWNEIE
jgi:hypothetical protein